MDTEQSPPSPTHSMFSLTGEKPEQLSPVGCVEGSKNNSGPFALTQGNQKISHERGRAVPGLFINSARLLGYEVPEGLIIYSGEMFYQAGRLEEVRLFGFYIVQESDTVGGMHLRRWATLEEPKFSLIPGRGIELHPSDKNRAYIAYSGEPSRPYIDWDLKANAEV
jgi:hypothetical protein